MQANYGKERPPSPSKSAYSGNGRERGNSGLSVGGQDASSNSVGGRSFGQQLADKITPRDSMTSMSNVNPTAGMSRTSNYSQSSAKGSTRQTASPLITRQKERTCPLHHKSLEVFCASSSCLSLVCSDCALFGAHQKHTFKQVDEVKRLVLGEVDKLNLIREQLWKGYQWTSDNPALKHWQDVMHQTLNSKVTEIDNYFEVELPANIRICLDNYSPCRHR